MIIRINSATGSPFVISAVDNTDESTDGDVKEQAKAIALVLYRGLPGDVWDEVYEHFKRLDQVFPKSRYTPEYSQYINDLEQAVEKYEIK